MNQTIVIRVFCDLLMLVTSAVLIVGWTGELSRVEPVSIAVVFAGALIGRCVLESRPPRSAPGSRMPE